MNKIIIILVISLLFLSLQIKAQDKTQGGFQLNKKAQILLIQDYKQYLIVLSAKIRKFRTDLRNNRRLGVSRVESTWLSIARDYQKYGVPFTDKNIFVIPTYEEFNNNNFSLVFPINSIEKEIKHVSEILGRLR